MITGLKSVRLDEKRYPCVSVRQNGNFSLAKPLL